MNTQDLRVSFCLSTEYADALRTETERCIAAKGGGAVSVDEVARHLFLIALLLRRADLVPVQPPVANAMPDGFGVIAAEVAKHGTIQGTVLEFRERFRGIAGLDGKGAATWLVSRARRAGIRCKTVGHRYVSAKERFNTHGAYTVYALSVAA
jgi:hypothetical protein